MKKKSVFKRGETVVAVYLIGEGREDNLITIGGEGQSYTKKRINEVEQDIIDELNIIISESEEEVKSLSMRIKHATNKKHKDAYQKLMEEEKEMIPVYRYELVAVKHWYKSMRKRNLL